MSDEKMLTIKTKFDPTGAKEFEAQMGRTVDTVKKSVDDLESSLKNVSAKRDINIEPPKTTQIIKEVTKVSDSFQRVEQAASRVEKATTEVIKKKAKAYEAVYESARRAAEMEQKQASDKVKLLTSHLDDLETKINRKQWLLSELEDAYYKTGAGAVEGFIARKTIQEELNGLEKEQVIVSGKLSKETLNLAKANTRVNSVNAKVAASTKTLTSSFAALARAATMSAASTVGASQRSVASISRMLATITKLPLAIAGPLALAVGVAVSALSTYAISLFKAEDTSKKYTKTLEELKKRYDDLALSTKDAENRTKEFIERQKAGLDLRKTGAEQAIEDAKKDVATLLDIKERVTDMWTSLESVQSKTFANTSLQRIHDDMKAAFASLDGSKESAEILAVAVANAAQEMENLSAKDGGALKKSHEFNILSEMVKKVIAPADALADAFARIADIDLAQKMLDPIGKLDAELTSRFKQTSEGRREMLVQEIETAKKLVASSLDPALIASMTSGDAARYRKQAKIILAESEKDLADYNKRIADAAKKNTGSKKEDPVAALEKRYTAQKEIAGREIADEAERSEKLLSFERAYYAEKDRLLRDDYEKRIASGKEVSDAQIAELQRVVEKSREIADKSDPLQDIENSHKAKIAVARATATEEKALEEELATLRKQYLQERLSLLLSEAEMSKSVRGEIKEDLIASIKEVKTELDTMSAPDSGMAKEVSKQMSQWGGMLNNMASNLGDFMSAQYDAKIQSLDKALERELRMIDNALQQEMAMYEEQLKQYENLEEDKKKRTEDHQEEMEELNWKLQEHLTEDEWRRIMEQRTAAEEKYAEDMLLLEEETMQRDAIKLQQEQAEAEALARKEQLEKEYAIRRAQMERKQAQAQKATALFQAVIMTAVGIARAFADHIWPLNMAVAAIAAAAGGVQIAAIAARPLPAIPSFSEGGTIGCANSNFYSHVPQADNPYDKTLLWGRVGEEVLNLKESGVYRALKEQGLTLAGFLGQRQIAFGGGGQSIADNSRTVSQTVHITARNELTFAEARRLTQKQNRNMVRALA